MLGFAERRSGTGEPDEDRIGAESGLTFLGLATLGDQPRPDVEEAVGRCREAGIRIIVITGDHGLTAGAVARRVGIERGEPRMVSGPEIGIAMRASGTEVAREAATMVLTDDSFSSIVATIEEGRVVYENIRKFVTYIFAHATPEVVPFLIYALSGGAVPLPLTVMQILAIDLGTETLPALALGREPAEPGILRRPDAIYGCAWRCHGHARGLRGMFPTTILLAVDGSPDSDRATRMATRLSKDLDSELHVVLVGRRVPVSGTVQEHPPLDADFESWAREILERDARERLEEQVGKIRAEGVEVSGTHPRIGHPDAEIVRLSEEIGAGLVVVGSRGLGHLKRAVMGSVSRSVVRHNHCPVLVVRCGRGDPFSGAILVGADGSREAAVAARAGAEISTATGTRLHLVYVMRTERYRPQPGPEAWEGWQDNVKRATRAARSWIEGQAKRLRIESGAKSVEGHLVFGDPDCEIVRLAEELDAGLVILGSRGLGGVRRMLLGSVSDSVVEHAPGPVMVVRVPARRAGGR